MDCNQASLTNRRRQSGRNHDLRIPRAQSVVMAANSDEWCRTACATHSHPSSSLNAGTAPEINRPKRRGHREGRGAAVDGNSSIRRRESVSHAANARVVRPRARGEPARRQPPLSQRLTDGRPQPAPGCATDGERRAQRREPASGSHAGARRQEDQAHRAQQEPQR
jgi:hypothetical protein